MEVLKKTLPSWVISVALHHRVIDLPEKAVGNRLGNMGKVHIHIFHLLPVDLPSESRAALIRCPPGDGFRSARASSMLSPHEAPVKTRILKDSPFLCRPSARLAKARGTAFAAPAGVKPLKATVAPWGIWATASSALNFGNPLFLVIIFSLIVFQK